MWDQRLSRRTFLTLLAVTALAPGCAKRPRKDRVGIALGSGGARGIAHALMLEVLDELGIRPYRIAGASIGAVLGVLYAGGLSGRAIRDVIDSLTVSKQEGWLDSLLNEQVARWWEFFDPTLQRGGLLDSEHFLRFLLETCGCSRFADLQIPTTVVAADFWTREQVLIRAGELLPALKASTAVPGLFTPVEYRGQVLVDGGLVNPVPYDVLFADCDLVIGIDVLGSRTPGPEVTPTYFENTFNTFQIMQAAIMREKLARRPPDIYIRPDIHDVRVLEFYKADEIYSQAQSAQKQLRKSLGRLLGV